MNLLLTGAFLVALLAVLYAPGYLAIRSFGAKGALGLAIAPSISALMLTLTGVILHAVGIPWNHLTVLALLASLTAIVFGLSRILLPFKPLQALSSAAHPFAYWGTRVTAGIVAILFLAMPIWLGTFSMIPQHSDSIFHLNGVWVLGHYHDGYPFGGLSPLYGVAVKDISYPLVWHQWISTVSPQSQILLATNVALVSLRLIWLHGMVVLGSVLFPNRRRAQAAIPLLVLILPTVPIGLTNVLSRWPNALMLCLLPGLIALATFLSHFPGLFTTGQRIATKTLIVLSFAGAFFTHYSAAVCLLFLLIPSILQYCYHTVQKWRSQQLELTQKISFVTAWVLFGLWTALIFNQAWTFLKYAQIKTSTWNLWFPKLLSLLRMYQRNDGLWWQTIPLNLIILLLIVGIVDVLLSKRRDYLLPSFLFFGLLCYASLVPMGILTTFTGWWYSDPIRMMGVLSLAGIPLSALGADRIYKFIERYWLKLLGSNENAADTKKTKTKSLIAKYSLLAIAITLLTTGSWNLRATLESSLYSTILDPSLQQISPGEEAFQKRIAKQIPPGELVLGEAANGSALLASLHNTDVALKQQNYSKHDYVGRYLRKHFSEIATDPRVCMYLRKYHIKYFYYDPQDKFAEISMRERSPGLYNVPTGLPGFTLIDHVGKIQLWKIDYCDTHFLDYPPAPLAR
ncbi:hypothetical protein BSR28_07600 [Boudabousia liubingyangii]|uniref:DUF6541 family protein n=1 Tax=Boudabousia liubingyangii TaxID=1921764 RepID=UPI0009390FBF|nr:DUF6541 family protein [Boudabousia liubingyangii]OKL46384.1 hypothetical protein BSR28_07600 [Boudabousia liubingyangii]